MAIIIWDTTTGKYLGFSSQGEDNWVDNPNEAQRFFDSNFGKLFPYPRFQIRHLSELFLISSEKSHFQK